MENTKTGTKKQTPQLYSYYDKQYQFNDLRRDADEGFSEYLQTLRRGSKDQDEFYNAYNNIMTGIGDGSITFQNGRFNDSLGRYTNGTGNKSKDYYGLVANYIAGKLGKSKEYSEDNEADKIKWNPEYATKSLMQNLFNTDNPTRLNYQYFLDLDPVVDGKRGVQNRVKALSTAIQSAFSGDFRDKYTGLSDEDYQKYTGDNGYINQAIASLADNSIDPGDTLTLSRLLPGLDFNSLFTTEENPLQTNESENPESKQQEGNEYTYDSFVKWAKEHYPRYSGDLRSFNISPTAKYGQWTANQFSTAVGKLNNDALYKYTRTLLYNPTYKPSITISGKKYYYDHNWGTSQLLNSMKNKGLLKQLDDNNPDVYYIPHSVNSKTWTAWLWDSANNTLSEKSIHDIPYWRDKIMAEYKGVDDDYSVYQSQFQKNGGVLKAQSGTKLWNSDLKDFDPAGYTTKYNTDTLINSDFSDDVINPWISNQKGLGAGRYLPSKGNSREYTQNIENNAYYKQFGSDLIDENGNFTEMGLKWAQMVDANLPKGSTASFFDDSGKLRTSWTVKNQDVYHRNPQTFSTLKDYVHYVRNDSILGARHNVFGKTGDRYFYKDSNGVEHWVDPSVIENYEVSADPIRTSWSDDNTIQWNDYEITGPKKVNNSKDSSKSTHVNLTGEKQRESSQQLTSMVPDLLATARMANTIRTNNRVAKVINDSLKPVLFQTYERYSPITGAFSEMQFRNRQAANLRRGASTAVTPDASLYLAGLLDANRQARDTEYAGFLADDKERQRTSEQALARQEDNIARRSDVANKNMASINQTNREKSQLEASRLRMNWQSFDNYLAQLEGRMRLKQEQDKANLQYVAQTQTQQEYSNYINELNKEFKRRNPNATYSDMLDNQGYTDAVGKFKSRLNYELNQSILNPYNKSYTVVPQSYSTIFRNVSFSKNGGTLRPSAMSLINKVIHNENNS